MVSCSSIYKRTEYIIAILMIIDAVLWFARLVIIVFPRDGPRNNSTVSNMSSLLASPYISNSRLIAAVSMDSVASIPSVIVAIYASCLCICCQACVMIVVLIHCFSKDDETSKKAKNQCKAHIRCMTLSCNFPCYASRPEMRLLVRLVITGLLLLLRLISTILYGSTNNRAADITATFGLSIASTAFVLVAIAIDYFRFHVWWFYKPAKDQNILQCCCCAKKYHPSHQGYLPEPLLGKYRDLSKFGNKPCPKIEAGECPSHSLRHIAVFHSFNFQPLKRYDPIKHKTYFGFHQTKLESAIAIAHTGFRISDKPPQMLGFGVYFARSFDATGGKARSCGKSLLRIALLKNIILLNKYLFSCRCLVLR